MSNEISQTEELKKKLVDKTIALKERIVKGEKILESEKIQVAVLADSPTVITGFANVCREILTNLHKTGLYAFDIVGINYDGSPHDLPFKIYPAVNGLMQDPKYREPYGRQRFLDMIGEGRFDIVWVLQDSFIVAEELGQRIKETNDVLPLGDQFTFIYYFPIDATPKKKWIDQSAMVADMPVVYTEYGYNEILKLYSVDENSKLEEKEKEKNLADKKAISEKLSVIYHGVNLEDFHPIEDEFKLQEFRNKMWGNHKDKFVFMNVNRNQPRKDLYRTLQAFKILLDRRRAKGKDDVYLYMHCNIFDNDLNMLDMCKQLNLTEGDEWAFPDPKRFGPSSGFPTHILNDIYNSVDAIVTTTLGEGWGLSISEGMAVKKPVIAPDHTSISEILGKTNAGTAERGILVKTKDGFVQQHDNSRVRPITDAEDLADKMEMVMENRAALQPMVDSAYEWIKRLQWGGEEIMGKWEKIFTKAYEYALIKRAVEFDKAVSESFKNQKVGRNDICKICNDKFKHCRHGQLMGI
jgi:glycosyltransferase involved in cell wall biosynthesis